MPKSSAQRSKEYRERLRLKFNKTKKKPKSSAERARDYRARKKAINAVILNWSVCDKLENTRCKL